ncbi:MAG: cofactor-independent phosphoglycerate mutase [Clostridia bacterium]
MKYIVILGDGMADDPIAKIGGKTPLEVANKPNMDFLAQNGEVGIAKTVPDNLPAGSDVANLSMLGYNPSIYYKGRSPLEAVSMGINIKENDVTFRANLVTLSDDAKFEDKTMIDYSAGEITTEEAVSLIEYVAEKIDTNKVKLYPGISYRHCLCITDGSTNVKLVPPHDISDKKITEYLPKGDSAEYILNLMKKSEELLKNHPINLERIKQGKNPASSLWIWGQGTKPTLSDFKEKTNLNGGVISAVDLLKGIAICANMRVIEVEGATGNINTNYKGKTNEAIAALRGGLDFVYIHIEAADECGHQGNLENKIKAIENIDKEIVGPILKEFENEDVAIMVAPDHKTPVELKTHTKDYIPYIIYKSNKLVKGVSSYNEKLAATTKIVEKDAYKLIDKLIK